MILAAMMMLGGASSAWADTSTIYNWGTTTDGGATVWTDAEKSNWGASASINEGFGMGVSNSSSGTLTASRTLEVDATAILTYTAKWHVVVGYSKDNYALLSLGNYVSIKVGGDKKLYVTTNGEESEGVALSFYSTSDNKTHSTTVDVSCTVNTVTNRITSLTIGDSISTKYTASSAIVMDGARTSNTVTLSKTATGKRLISSRLKSLKIDQETQALSKYGYTIKYMTDVNDDATTVKTVDMTAEENKVYDGSWVYIENSPFTESETKYYIADDATMSFQITSDNQVYKVKVREAGNFSWQLRGETSDHTDLGLICSGTQTEGETVNTYYKRYLLKDGTLYGLESSKGADKNYFKHHFTVTEDNQVEKLTYTITDITHIVALVEVEDIEGVSTKIYLDGRSSGGDNANPNGKVMATLSAGSYKIFACAATGSADRSIVFKCGSTMVGTATLTNTTNCTTTNTDWFSLTGVSNDITAQFNQTSTNGRIDYLYIQQQHETVTDCDNLGYTFSSTLPLDFSGTSVRAYIATYDNVNDVVKLTQVNKVPANTGVLIFSNSELTNQSIPVTAESTDDVTGNKLVAVSEAMTLSAAEGDNENYVLAIDIEEGKAVFQLVSETSASMSAGQAYLQIPKRTGEGARSLRIVFDDETTGVRSLTPSPSPNGEGSVYTLSGQRLRVGASAGMRVVQPTKGLYIVNGKKVIVK